MSDLSELLTKALVLIGFCSHISICDVQYNRNKRTLILQYIWIRPGAYFLETQIVIVDDVRSQVEHNTNSFEQKEIPRFIALHAHNWISRHKMSKYTYYDHMIKNLGTI